jgi:hypothetical protein
VVIELCPLIDWNGNFCDFHDLTIFSWPTESCLSSAPGITLILYLITIGQGHLCPNNYRSRPSVSYDHILLLFLKLLEFAKFSVSFIIIGCQYFFMLKDELDLTFGIMDIKFYFSYLTSTIEELWILLFSGIHKSHINWYLIPKVDNFPIDSSSLLWWFYLCQL